MKSKDTLGLFLRLYLSDLLSSQELYLNVFFLLCCLLTRFSFHRTSPKTQRQARSILSTTNRMAYCTGLLTLSSTSEFWPAKFENYKPLWNHI